MVAFPLLASFQRCPLSKPRTFESPDQGCTCTHSNADESSRIVCIRTCAVVCPPTALSCVELVEMYVIETGSEDSANGSRAISCGVGLMPGCSPGSLRSVAAAPVSSSSLMSAPSAPSHSGGRVWTQQDEVCEEKSQSGRYSISTQPRTQARTQKQVPTPQTNTTAHSQSSHAPRLYTAPQSRRFRRLHAHAYPCIDA